MQRRDEEKLFRNEIGKRIRVIPIGPDRAREIAKVKAHNTIFGGQQILNRIYENEEKEVSVNDGVHDIRLRRCAGARNGEHLSKKV